MTMRFMFAASLESQRVDERCRRCQQHDDERHVRILELAAISTVITMNRQSTISPALLTKALLRAVEQLELSAELPPLLQVPPEETAQLESGTRLLDPEKQEWASALKIVGLFRTMIELLGTPERAKGWLSTPNDTLGGRPRDLLRTADAELVYRYLGAVRKHELRMPPAERRNH